jgi:hypothetical protein
MVQLETGERWAVAAACIVIVNEERRGVGMRVRVRVRVRVSSMREGDLAPSRHFFHIYDGADPYCTSKLLHHPRLTLLCVTFVEVFEG